MLFAQRGGVFRAYNDTVFERFWKRELDIEDRAVIRRVLEESGADASGFFDFLDGEGRREHDRISQEAESIGVFGVPSLSSMARFSGAAIASGWCATASRKNQAGSGRPQSIRVRTS